MQLLKIYILSMLVLLFAIDTKSEIIAPLQEPKLLTLELGSGFMTVNLSTLASARDDALSKFLFPAKVTDDYPTNPFINGAVLVNTGFAEIGLTMKHISTGTRVHYADYSGEYKFDQTVTMQEIGATIRLPIKMKSENWNSCLFGTVGRSIIKIHTLEKLQIGEEKQESKEKFSYGTEYLEFGGALKYKVGLIDLGLSASLMLLPDNELPLGFDGGRASLLVSFSPF